MKILSSKIVILLTASTAFIAPFQAHAEDYKYAKTFEQLKAIQMALSADDLETAKNIAPLFGARVKEELPNASNMFQAAEKMTKADSLEKARSAFGTMSSKFSNKVTPADGYYTFVCPTANNRQFVQREMEVKNCPYGGKANPTCGKYRD